MTVSNQSYKVGPTTGTGSLSVYNYPYRVDADSHLKVVETLIATGVETVLTQGADYTLSGVGAPYLSGVNVTLTAGNLPTTKTITLYRDTPLSQEVDLGAQEDLNEESVELGLDRGVLLLQEISGEQERNLKVPVTTDLSSVSTTIPVPEAGKLLAGKTGGTGWENVEPSVVGEIVLPSMTGKDDYPLLVDETGGDIKYGTAALGDLAYLGTVDTAQIVDNAVTLAKMEHGASGDVLYYGASGVPTRLTKGTDGQYLGLSSGIPTWETVVGDLFPVRSIATLSSDAAFTISDIEDYDVNIIDGYHVVPANDDQFFRLQVGVADVIQTSGYEWQTGTADYQSGTANHIATTSDDATATTGIKNSTSGWNFRFHIEIYGAADTSHLKWIEGWVLYRAGNGSAPRKWPFGGWYETSNAAITDIKGFMSSGAFTSGTVVHRAGDLS